MTPLVVNARIETLPERIAIRLRGRAARRVTPGLRAAAVLLPLVDGPSGPRLLLTRRAADLRRQPGEISFPGGMVEPAETGLEAALREAREEIGLDPARVEILGRLDERRTYHGFRLSPFVGWIRDSAPLGLEPGPEVEFVFSVPWSALADGSLEATEVQPRLVRSDGTAVGPRVIYRYPWRGHDVWGLTARIIRDLLDVAL